MKVDTIKVLSKETHGEGGFLSLCRMTLVNQRQNGSFSNEYISDFVLRSRSSLDAVVVVIYRKIEDKTEVLLRQGLRPPMHFGRTRPKPLYFTEVIAGVLEKNDIGEQGIKDRAVLEVFEESGIQVDKKDVHSLGAASFPAPGAFPECLHLMSVEVSSTVKLTPPPGDGSPMEEGAECHWVEINHAIKKFVEGTYEDMKSELILRRLNEHLKK